MENSYFSVNYTFNNSYIIVYPLTTIQLLNLFAAETEITIEKLYIEEGEMLIDKPCPVYTDNNFDKTIKISELLQFLHSKKELFIMQFDFEVSAQNIRISVEDDIQIKLVCIDYSIERFNRFLHQIISCFPAYNAEYVQSEVLKNNNKYVCLNEKGQMWKIFDSYKELMRNPQVLEMY